MVNPTTFTTATSPRPRPELRGPVHWVTLFEQVCAADARAPRFMAEISVVDHNGNLGASYVGRAMVMFGVTSDLWHEYHLGKWAREEFGTAGCDNSDGRFTPYYQADVAKFVAWIKRWFDQGGRAEFQNQLMTAVMVKRYGYRRKGSTTAEAIAILNGKFDIRKLVKEAFGPHIAAAAPNVTLGEFVKLVEREDRFNVIRAGASNEGAGSGGGGGGSDWDMEIEKRDNHAGPFTANGVAFQSTAPMGTPPINHAFDQANDTRSAPQSSTNLTDTTNPANPIPPTLSLANSLAALDSAISRSTDDLSLMAASMSFKNLSTFPSRASELYTLRDSASRLVMRGEETRASGSGSGQGTAFEKNDIEGKEENDMKGEHDAAGGIEHGKGKGKAKEEEYIVSAEEKTLLDFLYAHGLNHPLQALQALSTSLEKQPADIARFHDSVHTALAIHQAACTGEKRAVKLAEIALDHVISQDEGESFVMLDWHALSELSNAELDKRRLPAKLSQVQKVPKIVYTGVKADDYETQEYETQQNEAKSQEGDKMQVIDAAPAVETSVVGTSTLPHPAPTRDAIDISDPAPQGSAVMPAPKQETVEQAHPPAEVADVVVQGNPQFVELNEAGPGQPEVGAEDGNGLMVEPVNMVVVEAVPAGGPVGRVEEVGEAGDVGEGEEVEVVEVVGQVEEAAEVGEAEEVVEVAEIAEAGEEGIFAEGMALDAVAPLPAPAPLPAQAPPRRNPPRTRVVQVYYGPATRVIPPVPVPSAPSFNTLVNNVLQPNAPDLTLYDPRRAPVIPPVSTVVVPRRESNAPTGRHIAGQGSARNTEARSGRGDDVGPAPKAGGLKRFGSFLAKGVQKRHKRDDHSDRRDDDDAMAN